MRTRLTRRYRFSAVHVLARPDWPDERNRAVYGKCANPSGHGHNYRIEVTVGGEVDLASGRLVSLEALDRTVCERLTGPLHLRHLNRDVAAFAREVPTAENIARLAWRTLAPVVPGLERVRLVETPKNSVEYRE